MPDEPTLGELQRTLERGLSEINSRLDKVVSQDVYAAERDRLYDRIADLQGDLAEEKAERVKGDLNQQNQLDKLVAGLRWTAASVAIPVVLFVADLLRGK